MASFCFGLYAENHQFLQRILPKLPMASFRCAGQAWWSLSAERYRPWELLVREVYRIRLDTDHPSAARLSFRPSLVGVGPREFWAMFGALSGCQRADEASGLLEEYRMKFAFCLTNPSRFKNRTVLSLRSDPDLEIGDGRKTGDRHRATGRKSWALALFGPEPVPVMRQSAEIGEGIGRRGRRFAIAYQIASMLAFTL